MIWLLFLGSAVLTVLAGVKLADYGDVIGVRTGLGGVFVGTLLLSSATSLPELLTAFNAVSRGLVDLTAGGFFGSSMFNMLILALLDLSSRHVRILRRVVVTHSVTAGMAVLLTALAVLFILGNIQYSVAWMGLDSLLVIATYVVGVWFIQNSRAVRVVPPIPVREETAEREMPSLTHAVIGFVLAAAVLLLATPLLVQSADGIAEITGLGTGLVGLVFVAFVTSLPEVVTTVSAARHRAYDLAVGNLFGSNMFNIFALALVDIFYTEGRLLGAINPIMTLAGLLAIVLISLAGVGNVARVERRIWFMEVDALLIVLAYALGVWLLFSRQIVG